MVRRLVGQQSVKDIQSNIVQKFDHSNGISKSSIPQEIHRQHRKYEQNFYNPRYPSLMLQCMSLITLTIREAHIALKACYCLGPLVSALLPSQCQYAPLTRAIVLVKATYQAGSCPRKRGRFLSSLRSFLVITEGKGGAMVLASRPNAPRLKRAAF